MLEWVRYWVTFKTETSVSYPKWKCSVGTALVKCFSNQTHRNSYNTEVAASTWLHGMFKNNNKKQKNVAEWTVYLSEHLHQRFYLKSDIIWYWFVGWFWTDIRYQCWIRKALDLTTQSQPLTFISTQTRGSWTQPKQQRLMVFPREQGAITANTVAGMYRAFTSSFKNIWTHFPYWHKRFKKKKYFCVCAFSSPGSSETRLLLLLFPAGLLLPLSSHSAVFTRQIKLQDTFKSKQLSTHISAFLGHVASPWTLTDYTLFFFQMRLCYFDGGFFFF